MKGEGNMNNITQEQIRLVMASCPFNGVVIWDERHPQGYFYTTKELAGVKEPATLQDLQESQRQSLINSAMSQRLNIERALESARAGTPIHQIIFEYHL